MSTPCYSYRTPLMFSGYVETTWNNREKAWITQARDSDGKLVLPTERSLSRTGAAIDHEKLVKHFSPAETHSPVYKK